MQYCIQPWGFQGGEDIVSNFKTLLLPYIPQNSHLYLSIDFDPEETASISSEWSHPTVCVRPWGTGLGKGCPSGSTAWFWRALLFLRLNGMDWKLNLNKSLAYEDTLIAAAKLSPGEMFSYFYFILAFLGAVLATDVNFCIKWWCFFLSPTALVFTLSGGHALFPSITGIAYNCAKVFYVPYGSVVKNLSAYAADRGSIPGSGRSPGGRKWLPTPVFLPGELHGHRNLADYRPWGCKELDMTEWLRTYTHTQNCMQYLVITYSEKKIWSCTPETNTIL